MLVLAIVLGGIIGGIVAAIGAMLARGDRLRAPRALDPEYRHHEVVSCGMMVALGMKAGSVGAGVGAVAGLLVYLLAF